MSDYTTNYNLFKYNITSDSQSPFDIQRALNENWDKIDLHTHSNYALTSHTHSNYASIYHTHSGMLTATQTLNLQGYMKFSNNLLLEWGSATSTTKAGNYNQKSIAITFAPTYNTVYLACATGMSSWHTCTVGSLTNEGFSANFRHMGENSYSIAGCYWISLGI